MELDIKSIIIGMIVTSLFIIMGYSFNDLFYPFAAIGLLYVGYKQTDIKNGVIAGVITAIPIVILAFFGYLGHFSGFFTTTLGLILTAAVIILVGAFVGFVGAWAKRDRVRALEEYERKQKKGKKKKK